jgi:hypothetical protein
MTLEKLKIYLANLSWEEQMDFELSERYPEDHEKFESESENKIQKIAKSINPSLLDLLEQDVDFMDWALRLSQYIDDPNALCRAYRLRNHSDRNIRYWADKIISLKKS